MLTQIKLFFPLGFVNYFHFPYPYFGIVILTLDQNQPKDGKYEGWLVHSFFHAFNHSREK